MCEILSLHSYQAANVLEGKSEGDDDSDDSNDITHTLLEIDYDTVVDDEDVVDEFTVFKSTLEGWFNDTNTQM